MSILPQMNILGYVPRITWLYVLVIAAGVTFYTTKRDSENMGYDEYLKSNSSVWCNHYNNSKLCKFKNICYNQHLMTFIFFLGSQSVIKGLSSYRDFQTIQLSSVSFHNKFEANVSVSTVKNNDIKVSEFIRKGLLFSRFKPDNIMHVIHDDLIPVYLTLEEICLGDMVFCEQNFRLMIHDNYPKGPYFKLYEIFSKSDPIILTELPKKTVLCFDELHMGLIMDSIFYQYGFNKLQGPVEDIKLTPYDLSRFVNFITYKLKIETENDSNMNDSNILLVSRKKTRRIMNEDDLKRMLRVYKNMSDVIVLDLSESNTEVFIKEMLRTSVFVGMHGAEMIFSVFLKPNSTVIELFPYGIESNVVSFIKPLAKIEGMYFKYINWSNTFKNLTLFHPEADPLHGGIIHLPDSIQNDIKSVKQVPPVKCCNNPMYLYYMYQDTWIHPDFEKFLRDLKTTQTSNSRNPTLLQKWFFPDVVSNVTCSYDSESELLHLSWTKPYNFDDELVYDITITETNSNFVRNILTEDNFIKLNILISKPFKFEVWVAAIFKNNRAKSKDLFFTCK